MSRIYKKIKSPMGDLYLVASAQALEALIFANTWTEYKKKNLDIVAGDNKIIQQANKELSEYWRGERRSFNIPLKMTGTDFQIKAWKALTKIPFGKTKSYKEQAIAINSAKAVRAVGAANGKNPIAIVVPCHRVIGSNKKLTGYASGLGHKEFLLKLENANFIK